MLEPLEVGGHVGQKIGASQSHERNVELSENEQNNLGILPFEKLPSKQPEPKWFGIIRHTCKPVAIYENSISTELPCLCADTLLRFDPLDKLFIYSTEFDYFGSIQNFSDSKSKDKTEMLTYFSKYSNNSQVLSSVSVSQPPIELNSVQLQVDPFKDATLVKMKKLIKFLAKAFSSTILGENMERAPFYDTTIMHQFCGSAALGHPVLKSLAKHFELKINAPEKLEDLVDQRQRTFGVSCFI